MFLLVIALKKPKSKSKMYLCCSLNYITRMYTDVNLVPNLFYSNNILYDAY